MGAYSPSENVGEFMMLNVEKEYHIITYDFSSGVLQTRSPGRAMSSLQNYSSESADNIAVYAKDNWFFSGTTNRIETSPTFTEPIGVIMSSEYNRAKKWLVSHKVETVVPTDGTITEPSGDTTNLETFYVDTTNPDNLFLTPELEKNKSEYTFNVGGFEHAKSKWTLNACPGSAREIKFTHCDYYKFLEPKIDPKTFNLKVPTFELKADLEKMKTMDCSTSNEIDFSFMDDPLRNVCFPKVEILGASQSAPLPFNEEIINTQLDPSTNESDVF